MSKEEILRYQQLDTRIGQATEGQSWDYRLS
jgi:hypothetical protein